jgi:hypothetical protein
MDQAKPDLDRDGQKFSLISSKLPIITIGFWRVVAKPLSELTDEKTRLYSLWVCL